MLGTNLGELEFDYMEKDRVLSHVKRNMDGTYEVKDYAEEAFMLPFRGKSAENVSDEDLYTFFENRCFPRTRVGCDEVLAEIGLVVYDPYSIVRRTYGRFYTDFFWIRFSKDKAKSYEDVRKELGLER